MIDGGIADDDAGPADAGILDGRLWDGRAREPSGPQWVARFPDDRDLSSLELGFAVACQSFIDALIAAGAAVQISATRRPPQRAYLMHFAYCIATALVDPGQVVAMAGVAINWVHPTPARSRAAAQAMVDGYRITHLPFVDSRHCAGRAIDMQIAWSGTLHVACADGSHVDLAGPRNGSNLWLHAVGVGYGVYKLVGDPPHWSDDGC
jgi:hypothetical protein